MVSLVKENLHESLALGTRKPKEFPVHHISAARSGLISEILEYQLGISNQTSQLLLAFGSIWVNQKRCTVDCIVEKGNYLRIHAEPRRFPSKSIEWKSTILYEHEEFVVIRKPSGIPVHATVDNFIENTIWEMSQVLKQDIYITQRLDTATEGILLLAKTKWFQSQFNKLLRERSIQKTYLARVEKPLERGLLVHYMQQTLYAPKIVSRTPQENWLECRLEILDVQKVDGDYDLHIDLLTGRTHQIRTQLADYGSPILGDALYGSQRENPWKPTVYIAPESIALRAQTLSFVHPANGTKFCFSLPKE